MEHEKKLNQLFEHLRNEQSVTEPSEIKTWIDVHSSQTGKKAFKRIFKNKFIMLMSTLSLIMLAGLLWISPVQNSSTLVETSANTNTNTNTNPVSENASRRYEAEVVSSAASKPSESNYVLPEDNRGADASDRAPQIEFQATAETNPVSWPEGFSEPLDRKAESGLRENAAPISPRSERSSGKFRIWYSAENVINVDTLFKGVKKVVFTGNAPEKIRVSRSSFKDVGLKCFYKSETKALVVWRNKDKAQCKLSYELKDSVLFLQFEDKGEFSFIAVGMIETNSYMNLELPDNIELDLQSGYGDVECSGIRGSSYKISSSYGDVRAIDIGGALNINTSYGGIKIENLLAEVRVKTNYGDVTASRFLGSNCKIETTYGDIDASEMKGKINLETGNGDVRFKTVDGDISIRVEHGDITGDDVTVREKIDLSSSYGDIRMQLNNPGDDLHYELQTDFGDLKIDKGGLKRNGNGIIVSGDGKIKVKAKSSFGNITLR